MESLLVLESECAEENPSIDVIFLARGVDYGLDGVQKFIQSYQDCPAGLPHNFYVIAKGWEGMAEYGIMKDMVDTSGAKLIDLPDDGYDLGAYARTATMLSGQYVVFFNSSSCIKQKNWLVLFYDAMKSSNNGIVRASGSWAVAYDYSRLGQF